MEQITGIGLASLVYKIKMTNLLMVALALIGPGDNVHVLIFRTWKWHLESFDIVAA